MSPNIKGCFWGLKKAFFWLCSCNFAEFQRLAKQSRVFSSIVSISKINGLDGPKRDLIGIESMVIRWTLTFSFKAMIKAMLIKEFEMMRHIGNTTNPTFLSIRHFEKNLKDQKTQISKHNNLRKRAKNSLDLRKMAKLS